MAVHQYLIHPLWTALEYDLVHYLDDVQHVSVIRHLQILPVEVVILYARVHQLLWRVRESGARDDAIAAVRVLSGLLQVDDGLDVFVFELLYDVVFGNQTIREALRAHE